MPKYRPNRSAVSAVIVQSYMNDALWLDLASPPANLIMAYHATLSSTFRAIRPGKLTDKVEDKWQSCHNETTPKRLYAHCAHELQNAQVLENQGPHFELHGQNCCLTAAWGLTEPRFSHKVGQSGNETKSACPSLWP
jgi:hypothetical protein